MAQDVIQFEWTRKILHTGLGEMKTLQLRGNGAGQQVDLQELTKPKDLKTGFKWARFLSMRQKEALIQRHLYYSKRNRQIQEALIPKADG